MPAGNPPPLRFSKMHGAGNDFVIIDRRRVPLALAPERVRRIADRHTGVGCDQLITIDPPRTAAARISYSIWNTDGGPARQCGNGARCIVAWLDRAGEWQQPQLLLDSPAGVVEARREAGDGFAIAMGEPAFDPAAIGLDLTAADSYELRLAGRPLAFGAVSMGNPHAVVEVDDVQRTDVAVLGQLLQQAPQFSDSCNVGFVQRLTANHVRLRVYERGVGETLACGSGACAAVAFLRRCRQVDARVTVDLPGGRLQVDWEGEGSQLWLSGPTEFVFEGELCA